MAVTRERKQEIIRKFQRDESDTGSPEVQIAILTARINDLSEHLKRHRKDVHSRLGLVKMVSRRKKLLDYLRRTNYDRYVQLINELGLRK